MTMFKRAYEAGRQAAFQKFAVSADGLVTALGAISPTASGLASGAFAPEGDTLGTVQHGVGTGLNAGAGRLVGGHIGAVGGRTLANLLKQDPELGAWLGSQLGKAGGGAAGAHVGQTWAHQQAAERKHKQEMGG